MARRPVEPGGFYPWDRVPASLRLLNICALALLAAAVLCFCGAYIGFAAGVDDLAGWAGHLVGVAYLALVLGAASLAWTALWRSGRGDRDPTWLPEWQGVPLERPGSTTTLSSFVVKVPLHPLMWPFSANPRLPADWDPRAPWRNVAGRRIEVGRYGDMIRPIQTVLALAEEDGWRVLRACAAYRVVVTPERPNSNALLQAAHGNLPATSRRFRSGTQLMLGHT